MYKKILIAVDGSEHSLRATEEAAKIASLANGSMVEVVLVAEFSQAKKDVLHSQGKEELDISSKQQLLPVEEKLKRYNLNCDIKLLYSVIGNYFIKNSNLSDYVLIDLGSRDKH